MNWLEWNSNFGLISWSCKWICTVKVVTAQYTCWGGGGEIYMYMGTPFRLSTFRALFTTYRKANVSHSIPGRQRYDCDYTEEVKPENYSHCSTVNYPRIFVAICPISCVTFKNLGPQFALFVLRISQFCSVLFCYYFLFYFIFALMTKWLLQQYSRTSL